MTVSPPRFQRPMRRSINADGERRVSTNIRIWFRNGGQTSVTLPYRHQSKIYIESNRAIFSLIPLDLTSMQTLAIYRRLLEIDFRDRKRRNQRDSRTSKMFFLLRLVFWVGLVLVLLPRDKTPDQDKAAPQINASEAVSAATAAVSDMTQFCKRQPAACEVGSQAATVIGQRATDGARKLYHVITDKKAPD